MWRELLFFITILLANIIQGITGFAGTILAMPFSLHLVGYEIAKPVLNVHGIFSGFYVFVGNRKHVNWKELLKIVITMALGILAGIFIKGAFVGKEKVLYVALGIFIIAMAGRRLIKQLIDEKKHRDETQADKGQNPLAKYTFALVPFAGIIHGIFVCGGPLLTSYLTTRIKDKLEFRATISTVWIFLNSLILVDDIRSGFWTLSLLKTYAISFPFLIGGMFIGSKLVKRMSQELFMKITYVLLIISGISLLVK